MGIAIITTISWLCPPWTEQSAAHFHVDLLGLFDTYYYVVFTVNCRQHAKQRNNAPHYDNE